MHQKITGQIDSTYTAQSHNLESLQDWHMKNSHVSKLVLSSQVIFPFFASIFLALYFIYLIESEPANLGKKLNSQVDDKSPDEIKAAANSQVWIIVTISILFTSGAIATDIAALVEYSLLSKEIEYYINHNSSSAFVHLHVVPITMLFYDSLSTVFILVPFIVACCKCCKWTCKFKCCKTFGCYGEDGKCVFKISDILYTLLSPFTCIATHSYHIIFSFINNPYHATSVLLPVYIMTLFVVVVMLQKIFYFVLSGFQKFSDVQKRKKCAYGVIVIFYTVAIIATAGCIGLTVAVLIVLPLNNAIDLASNEIYAIYQASVTVFAALVTFQVLFRETNSSLAVLIKAADKYDSVTSLRKWEDMSEKEKEVQLGRIILSRVNFKKSEKETVGTQTGCCCAACYSYQRTREMEAGTQTELDNKKPTDASPTVNNKEPIIYPVYISNNTIPLKSTTNW